MEIVDKVIGVVVGVLLIGLLVPVAFVQIAKGGANMTAEGVDPTVVLVIAVLIPVLAGIGLALYFIPRWKK